MIFFRNLICTGFERRDAKSRSRNEIEAARNENRSEPVPTPATKIFNDLLFINSPHDILIRQIKQQVKPEKIFLEFSIKAQLDMFEMG